MADEAKSIDIKLYSVSKVEAAFEAAEVDDEQPAADVIATMKPKILEHLAAGRSIAWVISVLQRGGLDLGARQLRTYLQRAGIGVGAKRTTKDGGGTRRTTRKPKVADTQEDAVQASPVKDGNHADGAREVNVKTSCSAREAMCASGVQPAENASAVNEASAIAEAVQNANQDDGGQATGRENAPAENVQAVSDNAGGSSAVQTPRARKAGRHGAGTGAGGEPANGVHPSVAGFGLAIEDNDDDLL